MEQYLAKWNKLHGWGAHSLNQYMIKFCANAAADPLTLIFQNSVAAGTFSTFAIE